MFQFNPQVQLLLVNHSSEKVIMQYMNLALPAPLIKKRPPYYIHPQYGLDFPLI